MNRSCIPLARTITIVCEWKSLAARRQTYIWISWTGGVKFCHFVAEILNKSFHESSISMNDLLGMHLLSIIQCTLAIGLLLYLGQQFMPAATG